MVTIPVPLIPQKLLFNILELNTFRFDITSFVSQLKMVLSPLSLSTPMINRLISSQNLWMVVDLSSYAKKLVLFPQHDSFLPLSCIGICFQFFFFNKKKSKKYKNSLYLCILVLVFLGWPLKQSFLTLYPLQLR